MSTALPRNLKEAKGLKVLSKEAEYALVFEPSRVVAYKDKDGERWMVVKGVDDRFYRTQG